MQDDAPRLDVDYYRNWSLEKDAEGFDYWAAYQQSKLADILIAKEFSRRYPQLETASCHPGMIYTDMGKHVYDETMFDIVLDFIKEYPFVVATEGFWRPVKSPQEGASTTITAVSLPSNELISGGYYKDCAVGKASQSASNMDDAKALFDWCDEVTSLYQS
ncbi:daunorubicin C-13 ketoreductase DnrU [Seminavis robusta]|uniref:Daunorubicin C-13 ketoreductase DnrU n=1 Tax=Seminavis robusta TaxID=568900 RepID=A0A9N8HWN7_9STRA|nr:daunorubicin C-13 ketoreductase DnrU [Seminavis robusta]|eukprot:Sro2730_g335700.1 daunorubicin C-13 ketoreductase DnrU (161) ;mRNA; f:1048-1622